jgi:hypothetical protein
LDFPPVAVGVAGLGVRVRVRVGVGVGVGVGPRVEKLTVGSRIFDGPAVVIRIVTDHTTKDCSNTEYFSIWWYIHVT